MRHRIAKTVGLAGAALMLAVTPAFAGDGATSSVDGAASAWFVAYGDIIYVKDTKSDGHSALAQVQIPSAGVYENLWNPDGTGTTRNKHYSSVAAEGVGVWYRACTGEYSTGELIHCDDTWYYATTDN